MPSLSRYAPYVLGILRIVAAILFIEHGTQKLFGIPERMAGMTAAPEMLPSYDGQRSWKSSAGRCA